MKLSCQLCVWSVLAALSGCSRSGPEASQGCGSVENLGAPTCVAHASDSGQPLVAGAQVRLYAASGLADAVDYDVSSDAPEVVEVVDARITSECGQPAARITAKQPGTTRVRFTPAEGDPVIVEVRVELAQRLAVTPFLDDRASSVPSQDRQHPPVLVDELVQVAGGSMLWLVRYYGEGEQELRGRGLASITPPSFASAALTASDERELFELRTQTEGEGEIKLAAGATQLQLPVRSVPAAAVTSLQLYVEDDVADAGAGTRLSAMARGFDDSAKPVYGTEISYAVGNRQLGSADLIRYEVKPGAQSTLTATTGSASASVSIATDETAEITRASATELRNCSVGGSTDALANFALLAACVGLVLRRKVGRGGAPERQITM